MPSPPLKSVSSYDKMTLSNQNVMTGAIGGIPCLGVAALLYPSSKVADLAHVNYQPFFIVVSAIMVVAVIVLLITIREPALSAENQLLEQHHAPRPSRGQQGRGQKGAGGF